MHLLAAGAWLGGLLPLLLAVQLLPPLGGALAARWFSPLGKACVIAMTITAAFQGWQLIGDVPGLVGTAYGEMAIGKLGFFGALFAFAFVNRYIFAPALLGSDPAAARRTLLRSIAVQTGFGLAIVVAAALLSNLPPALHEQPLWPFDRQFSLVTVEEDPEFKQIVVMALLELGLAALDIDGGIVDAPFSRSGCCHCSRRHVVGCTGPSPSVRAGLPDQLLSLAHGVRRFLHHPWGDALSNELRRLPRTGWTWRRPARCELARPARRPYGLAPLGPSRWRAVLVVGTRDRGTGWTTGHARFRR